jgi:hypothetical protein
MAEWALLALRNGVAPKVLMVTARPPSAHDLREVDLLRREIKEASGTLVHDTIDQDPDSRDLIDWIMSGRPLAALPLAKLPDALGI